MGEGMSFLRKKEAVRSAYIEVDGIYINYLIYEGDRLLIRAVDTSMNFVTGLCRRVYGITRNEMKIVSRRTAWQKRKRALSVQ